MKTSFLLPLASLLGFTFAAPAPAPNPVEIAPRCGTTYYPTIIQQLSEAAPATVGANGKAFKVAGTGYPRVNTIVAFTGIAPGSYGCQLAMSFPAGAAITSLPAGHNTQMNVTKVFEGSPASITTTNSYTWNSIIATPPLGVGLYGTVSAIAGTSPVINTMACAPALAYVFSVAIWEGAASSVAFTQVDNPLSGIYLTANC